MADDKQRIASLDFVRGFASLYVCLFHFTSGNPGFQLPELIKAVGKYGYLGVEIFFVISGFVIPYSLARSNYQLKDFGKFVLKRIIRLDPPYLVALVLTVILAYISSIVPGYRGEPFKFSLIQFLLHLGYINVFFGYEWFNPVFWTLAIEFQYYLFIGLLFPLINHKNIKWRIAILCILSLLPFIILNDKFIFHYLSLFIMGVLIFQYYTKAFNRQIFIITILIDIIAIYAVLGLAVTIVSVCTMLAILYIKSDNKVFKFMGEISYSLYLVHVPIGGRIITLGARFAHTLPIKLIFFIMAFVVSIVSAYILYRLVEKPAQEWSSAIKYRSKSSTKTNISN